MPDLARLLIADDEQIVRDVLRQLLETDFDVTTVASGCELIQWVRQDSNFDVLLLDMNMPGPSVTEILDHVRRLNPAMQVLVLTGDRSFPGGEWLNRGPVYGVMFKPIRRNLLYAIVSEGAERSRAMRQDSVIHADD